MIKAIYPIIGNQTSLPFYLTGIGISTPENNIKRDNGLVSHQILYTKNGKGIINVQGCSYSQKEGSLFYLSPGVPHEYFADGNDWTTCWIVFRGEYLQMLMNSLGFEPFMVSNNVNLDLHNRIFNMIFAAANDPISGNEVCSKLVYEYILTSRKVLLSNSENKEILGSVIENAVLYINSNYYEDITLEQLALKSGISLQHFCRIFKSQMCMRPMEYIARKRISEAKVLLCSTADSISEIGRKTGYQDQTYFGIVFRKYEGISPSEYRRLKGSVIL